MTPAARHPLAAGDGAVLPASRAGWSGAIGSPAIFWLLLGSGFGESFRPAASLLDGYLESSTLARSPSIVLFTAIFSTVSIIEDRHEGIPQGVLVAPVSRIDIVTGKLLGGVAGDDAGDDLSARPRPLRAGR